MENTTEIKCKRYLVEDGKCTIKEKYGKCFIPLSCALFCLDCFTIHMQYQCPNCLSHNSVRLIELFLGESDASEDRIKKIIEKFKSL